MARLTTLLDSNVIVAGVAGEHSHHDRSLPVLMAADPKTFAVAGHSYAEAFNTLTRKSGPAPYAWTPARAWAVIDRVGAVTTLVGLTPAQTVDAVKRFAGAGGRGARVYDWLIGTAAVEAGIRRIITWNVTDLRTLFPHLEVIDPTQALA